MLHRIVPALVQSITHPYTVKTPITAYPSLLHFLQGLIVLGKDVGNGANTPPLRNGEGFNDSILGISSIHSSNTNDGGSSIDSPLGLFRRADTNDCLQSKRLGIFDKLGDLLRAHYAIRHRNGLRARIGSLGNLNLIHDQIGRNYGQRTGNLPPRIALFLHHRRDVVVGTSTGAIVSEHGDGGRAEFAEYGGQNFGGEDLG
mmetsp:Transcript_5800/g.14498  ORF Transcript_5800/g.14498 Transcript_5800/m.14498 type:complete len:201 (-) Transcript_5800:471-1073(-)